MTLSRYSRFDMIFIFFCGLIFFTIGLRNQEIIGFESRFYLFALEMWRHGISWFPTTYGEAYPDYPVTSTLLIYFTACVAGTLNKWVAVFPSAVASALTLVVTYLLGALQTRRWGWYAAGFLLFTLAFLTAARTISLDAYVTLFTALSFYFVYTRELQQRTPPFIIIKFLLIMSFAIRGPIGLIIPMGVISVFYLLEKKWQRFFLMGLLGLSLLVFCTAVLLLLAYHAGGPHFMHDVLQMEVFGRMHENKTPAGYFYFVESIGAYALTYPLAILVLLGVGSQLLKLKLPQQIKFLQILLGWIWVIMVGLSIPADKKIRYILPIAPALALICAYLLIVVSEAKYFRWLQQSFHFICRWMPLLGLCVLAILYYEKIALNYSVMLASLITIQLFMLVARRKDLIFFLAVLSFILCYIFIAERINLNINKTADFVIKIEKLRQLQHAKLVFYQEGKDGLVIKYLAAMPEEDQPLFISTLSEAPKQPAFIIASEEHFNALPEKLRQNIKVISAGKLGHNKVIIFNIDELRQ